MADKIVKPRSKKSLASDLSSVVSEIGNEDFARAFKHGGKVSKRKMKKAQLRGGGNISKAKARKILKDGTVHGNPLTDKQRRFFGAMSTRGLRHGGQVDELDQIIVNGDASSLDDFINASGISESALNLQEGGLILDEEAATLAGEGLGSGLDAGLISKAGGAGSQAIEEIEGINPDARRPISGALKRAGQGAAIGSVIPGVGTLIGAGLGAGLGILEGVAGNREAKLAAGEQRRKRNLQQDLIEGEFIAGASDLKHGGKVKKMDKRHGGKIKESKQRGGEIEGPGTGKSDSIDADVEENDFIIPIESAGSDLVKQMMKDLGIEGKANLDNGDVDVNLSDGEVLIPFDRVSDANEYLIGKGVPGGLNELAPEAESKLEEEEEEEEVNLQDGGTAGGGPRKVRTQEELDAIPFSESKLEELNTIKPRPFETNIPARQKRSADQGPVFDLGLKPQGVPVVTSRTPSKGQDINFNLGDALAVGQVGLGLTDLLTSGRAPERKISPELNKRFGDALTEEGFGFSPLKENRLKKDIELNRRGLVEASVKGSGVRSAGQAFNRMVAATSQANKDLEDVAIADESLRQRKKSRSDTLASKIAAERNQIFQDDLNSFNAAEASSANLTDAGISNLVGSQKLAKQIEERDKRNKLRNRNIFS